MSLTIARAASVFRPVALEHVVSVVAGGGLMLVLGGGPWAVAAGGLACASGLTLGSERRTAAVALAVAALAALAVAASGEGRGREVVLGNVPVAVAGDDATVGVRDEALPEPRAAAVSESPTALVRDFYADLDAGRFAAAWARLAPGVRVAFGGFQTWRHGYATTLGHRVEGLRVNAHGVVRHILVAVDRTPCGGRVARRFAVRWRFDGLRASALSATKLAGEDPAAAC